jgi:hypothetical protein
MKNFNLNRQLKFVRYGLPAIQMFSLIALMGSGQLLLMEFKASSGADTHADNATLFNLNRRVFGCLQQLKLAGTEPQNNKPSNHSNNENDSSAETGNQRFYDSKGARWIFNGEEKLWHKQP